MVNLVIEIQIEANEFYIDRPRQVAHCCLLRWVWKHSICDTDAEMRPSITWNTRETSLSNPNEELQRLLCWDGVPPSGRSMGALRAKINQNPIPFLSSQISELQYVPWLTHLIVCIYLSIYVSVRSGYVQCLFTFPLFCKFCKSGLWKYCSEYRACVASESELSQQRSTGTVWRSCFDLNIWSTFHLFSLCNAYGTLQAKNFFTIEYHCFILTSGARGPVCLLPVFLTS